VSSLPKAVTWKLTGRSRFKPAIFFLFFCSTPIFDVFALFVGLAIGKYVVRCARDVDLYD